MNDRTAYEMAEHLADTHQRLLMIWTGIPQSVRDQCPVVVHACFDISRDTVEEFREWRDMGGGESMQELVKDYAAIYGAGK